MDLIAQLAGVAGIDAEKAQALAGAVLGGAKTQLEQAGDTDAASGLQSAVPEMGGWLEKAQALAGGGGGGLGGMLGGMLGGSAGGALGAIGGAADVLGKLQALGLDASVLAKAAPLVLQFLEGRVDPGLLAKVKPLVGALAGGDAGKGNGLGGLSGLFG